MFVDTNVLVFASAPTAPHHARARDTLELHSTRGESLGISRQILREFLAVITRPQVWTSAKKTAEAATVIELLSRRFVILEDGPAVGTCLLELCRKFDFGGRQVHDANIVATMLAHGQRRLLTFDAGDFRRFARVIEVEDLAGL